MNHYIGIDLGTSSVKLLLMSADGTILKTVSRSYPVSYPHPGWSEQNPEDWVRESLLGLEELLGTVGSDILHSVRGMSFGGQMHGLVILDSENQIIRPAILWNDGRTQTETDFLNREIGEDKLSQWTGNIAFAGFTAPKLLWMRKNEPLNFARIARFMLPKDYLCYSLTGEFTTDVSDASGTLLFDVEKRCWSAEMLEICGIEEKMLPKICESHEAVGKLLPSLARKLGLGRVTVCAGAGDNAASAIGIGAVSQGSCSISLGTSGTVFLPSRSFALDPANSLHSFAFSGGKSRFHQMGCILSAASCGKWWLENILNSDDYFGETAEIDAAPSMNGVYFLPYLMGERSPHNDPNARGVFFGIDINTSRHDMTRAVYEGVTFALLDCVQAARRMEICPSVGRLCGGGSKSAVWQQLCADILEMNMEIPQVQEGTALGAAILSSVGCGEYQSVEDASTAVVKIASVIHPKRENAEVYRQRYAFFHQLYPTMHGLFRQMVK